MNTLKLYFSRELVKYGYNEWIQIQKIIAKHKGIHAQEVKLGLQQLINKFKKLNLVPSADTSHPFSSSTTPNLGISITWYLLSCHSKSDVLPTY